MRQRPDWYAIYQRLMHGKPRLKPWEIRRLTLPELAVALDQNLDTHAPPRDADAVGTAAVWAHLSRLRAMTPRERLDYERSR